MASNEKMVMQVTLSSEEFPRFFAELRQMRSSKKRVSKLVRLAYFGWLLEQGRPEVVRTKEAQADAAQEPTKQGSTIEEYVGWGGGDDDDAANTDARS